MRAHPFGRFLLISYVGTIACGQQEKWFSRTGGFSSAFHLNEVYRVPRESGLECIFFYVQGECNIADVPSRSSQIGDPLSWKGLQRGNSPVRGSPFPIGYKKLLIMSCSWVRTSTTSDGLSTFSSPICHEFNVTIGDSVPTLLCVEASCSAWSVKDEWREKRLVRKETCSRQRHKTSNVAPTRDTFWLQRQERCAHPC